MPFTQVYQEDPNDNTPMTQVLWVLQIWVLYCGAKNTILRGIRQFSISLVSKAKKRGTIIEGPIRTVEVFLEWSWWTHSYGIEKTFAELVCPLHFRLKTCEHGSKGWHHKFSHYLGVLLIALKRGFVRQKQKGDKKPIKNSLFPTIKRWPCALPGESHCIQKHLPVQRHFRSKQALNAGILDLKLSMYFYFHARMCLFMRFSFFVKIRMVRDASLSPQKIFLS